MYVVNPKKLQNPCSYTYSCIHIPLPLIVGSTNPQRPENTKNLISYTILSVTNKYAYE